LFENIIDMHHINGNEDSPYTVTEMFNYDYKTAEAGVSLMKGILMGLDIPMDGEEGTLFEPAPEAELEEGVMLVEGSPEVGTLIVEPNK